MRWQTPHSLKLTPAAPARETLHNNQPKKKINGAKQPPSETTPIAQTAPIHNTKREARNLYRPHGQTLHTAPCRPHHCHHNSPSSITTQPSSQAPRPAILVEATTVGIPTPKLLNSRSPLATSKAGNKVSRTCPKYRLVLKTTPATIPPAKPDPSPKRNKPSAPLKATHMARSGTQKTAATANDPIKPRTTLITT